MHCSAGFTLLLVILAALPLSVSAQAGEDGARSEPSAQEPVTEPASKEPALQLELEDAGVRITPSPARTPDGYTLEEAERRAQGDEPKSWLEHMHPEAFVEVKEEPKTTSTPTPEEEANARVRRAKHGVIAWYS